MSKAKEILKLTLNAVSDDMDIPCDVILSKCGRTEVVDARHITVVLLNRAGLYTMKIASLMKITPRYVQYILTDFEDRMACSRPLRNNYERIANKLRKDLEITALGG